MARTRLKYKVSPASSSSIPANAIHINSSWLTGKSEPYGLGQVSDTDDGTHQYYYVLDQDITVNHCAFYSGFTSSNSANKITLDLNGHTITYNNATPPSVPNGSFETSDLTNWSIPGGFSRASDSSVNQYLYSTYYLTGTTASTATIVSDSVSLSTGRQYSAWVLLKASSENATAVLEVIRASDSTVLATGPTKSSSETYRGYYVHCDFHVTSAETVKLRLTITPSASNTFVIDQFSIDHAWNSALRTGGGGDWEPFLPWHYGQLAGYSTVANRSYNIVVTDSSVSGGATSSQAGAIVMGQWGRCCHALDLQTVQADITVTGVRIEVQGIDSIPIWCYGGDSDNVTIQRNYIKFNTNNQVSRRMGVICGNAATSGTRYQSTAISGSTSQSVTVSNNTVVNVPQVCFGLRGGGASYTKAFYGNTVTMRGLVADPYFMGAGGTGPTRIYSNTVGVAGDRPSGRGIIMACDDQYLTTTDCEIYSNTFDLREVYNLEYQSSGIECAGFRLRNYAVTGTPNQSGIKFHDNNITVRTAGGQQTARVYGIRILIGDGTNYDAGLEVYNNSVTAITESASAAAHGIDIDAKDAQATGVRIYGNTSTSNHHSFCIGSNDAYQVETVSPMFMCNTSVKSAEYGGLVTYRSFVISDDTTWPDHVFIMHHTYDGSDSDIYWYSNNWPTAWSGTVYTGYRMNVYGSTSGETITVKDSSLNTLYSWTADTNGDGLNIPAPTTLRTYPKGGPESGSTTLTPIRVYYGASYQDITPTGDTDVTF